MDIQIPTSDIKLNKVDEIITKPGIRRVSISEQNFGIDNPAFENQNHRKVSNCSESAISDGRKKSILHVDGHYGSAENIENGRANGRKRSALSLSSSMRDKIEYNANLDR